MTNRNEKLYVMQELLLCAHSLHYWHLDSRLRLIFSNCPDEAFFYNLFVLNQDLTQLQDHFASTPYPVIASDRLGIVWIIGALDGDYHILGPFFSMEASENHIRQNCYRMRLSGNLIHELLSQLKQIPVIHLNASMRYGIMLQCALTGERLTASEITLHIKVTEETAKPDWSNSSWHGTWATEQELFNRIKDGNMNNFAELAAKFSAGNVGTMSHGDPLRQAKNEGIVFATLCSRAAILGGVSPEGGYNLADYYILRIEAADSASATQYAIGEMLAAFVRRVQQCKENRKYSLTVSSCMDYIETHISEKISLEAMAKELGYSSYYLSSKFQKETGMSINYYINRQKVEQAKRLLSEHGLSAADISERLAFSSPSYFTAVFRKFTGMTPSRYLQNH